MSEQELRAEVKRLRRLAPDIRALYSYAKNWVVTDEGMTERMEPFTPVRFWLEEVLELHGQDNP